MRKPTDICLLCKSSPATKTNSHIYPKFLSTNFLGKKGQPRRGFDLNSDKPKASKPKIIQDSPKENYLLCNDCEAYFGVLEGIASDQLINWRNKVITGEFSKKTIIDSLDIIECNFADKKTIRLLVYSIFWRASVSEHDLFKNFRIAKDFEEELRTTLMSYRFNNRKDYQIALTSKSSLKIYPYTAITARSFNDETANVLFAPNSLNPYAIIIDRFAFMLYRTPVDIKVDFIKEFSNIIPDDCRLMVFSEQLWHDTIVKGAFQLLAKKTIR